MKKMVEKEKDCNYRHTYLHLEYILIIDTWLYDKNQNLFKQTKNDEMKK